MSGATVDYKAVDAIMSQAQVFASGWSLVGGPLDQGDQLASAEAEKATLRAMIVQAMTATRATAPAKAATLPASEPVAEEFETVGAMHKCRVGGMFSQCVACGATAEALAKPCSKWLGEARAAFVQCHAAPQPLGADALHVVRKMQDTVDVQHCGNYYLMSDGQITALSEVEAAALAAPPACACATFGRHYCPEHAA